MASIAALQVRSQVVTLGSSHEPDRTRIERTALADKLGRRYANFHGHPSSAYTSERTAETIQPDTAPDKFLPDGQYTARWISGLPH